MGYQAGTRRKQKKTPGLASRVVRLLQNTDHLAVYGAYGKLMADDG